MSSWSRVKSLTGITGEVSKLNWLEHIKTWWKGQTEKSGKPWGILLIIGLLLAVIVWPTSQTSTGQGTEEGQGKSGNGAQGTENLTYEEQLEEKLAAILSRVKGAGAVQVMITLESSSELVLQVDESHTTDVVRETDSAGGTRDSNQSSYTKDTVQTGTDDGPYVIKEINPKVSGVLIIAEGAGSAAVKNEICEAVEALFNLPIHKIKVLEAE
ncbi:MAG: stage III sporulation protein AG [Lachnospiraceae bacterium]|nr:stage III sporulation protein AG [Lachnospiraceae bacterium]